MKPQELRLGNLVYGVSDRIERVISIQEDVISSYPHKMTPSPEDYFSSLGGQRSIDLTKDWLKQFGFKGRKDLVWNHSVAIQILGDQFFFAAKDRGGAYYQSLVQVKHVHHLQNLYFDITGEELTIKNQL